MEAPETHYTLSGDVNIAYQVVGEGQLDLVFIPSLTHHVELVWENPPQAQFFSRLSSLGRLLLFDKRGSGLSDPVRQVPTLETRMDDIRAVMDAAGSERAVLWAAHEGTRIALLFAATYPERTDALVLYDPTARGLWAPDYPWAENDDEWRRELRTIGERWGDRQYLSERILRLAPSRVDDVAFVDWFVWYMRRSASPAEAVSFHRMSMEGDVRDLLPTVRTPTLVLHRTAARAEAAYVTAQLQDAYRIEVEGLRDWFSWADPERNEVLLEETRRLVAGLSAPPKADRVLATVLFTDIVGSTDKAAELGDARWRSLLDRHHALVRAELARFRGEELDTVGDGFFAAFDGPGRAIECALAIRTAVRSVGLEIRAGLHTGECERIDGKLGGIAVPTGARVAGLAGDGEVLVSQTVKDLVAGSEIAFGDRGVHELKGVPGEWRLYAVLDA